MCTKPALFAQFLRQSCCLGQQLGSFVPISRLQCKLQLQTRTHTLADIRQRPNRRGAAHNTNPECKARNPVLVHFSLTEFVEYWVRANAAHSERRTEMGSVKA